MNGTTVDEKRLARDFDAIAACSECDPSIGYSRPTFSPAWRRARDYVIAQAQSIGCTVWVDAAGNVHARPATLPRDSTAWLCGSHIDSVPTGGRFDGVVGVLVALEALRTAPDAPMELIIFAEEEGTTFSLGMVGSRAWAGTLAPEELQNLRNSQGQDYASAGVAHGVSVKRLAVERLRPERYRGLIETHVEQGPGMWNAGVSVAVVTAIAGRRQYICSLAGEANHAGATAMKDRRDALAGAARAVSALEDLGREMARSQEAAVVTVGRMDVHPNSVNVIAGTVTFTIDLRARSDEMLAHGDESLRNIVSRIAAERRLGCSLSATEELPVVQLDKGICSLLRDAARRQGIDAPDVASGALHDAAILAPFLPTAMLFVASKGGISHNPAEYSRIEDVACAAQIVAAAVSSA